MILMRDYPLSFKVIEFLSEKENDWKYFYNSNFKYYLHLILSLIHYYFEENKYDVEEIIFIEVVSFYNMKVTNDLLMNNKSFKNYIADQIFDW